MRVVLAKSPDHVARLAADVISHYVVTAEDPVLGLATGGSVLSLYAELSGRVAAGQISFASCRAFLLDEYVGLPPEHPQSYSRFVADHFTAQVDIRSEHVAGLDGLAPDPEAECRRYETKITKAGGVGLQLLGIGSNGHIAFNEPGSSLASPCRPKILARSTVEDNSRYFESAEEVPTRVMTQGIGTILRAGQLLLVALGMNKAEALARAVEGPVAAMCPASALQLHAKVIVIADAAAASQLQLAQTYAEYHTDFRPDATTTDCSARWDGAEVPPHVITKLAEPSESPL